MAEDKKVDEKPKAATEKPKEEVKKTQTKKPAAAKTVAKKTPAKKPAAKTTAKPAAKKTTAKTQAKPKTKETPKEAKKTDKPKEEVKEDKKEIKKDEYKAKKKPELNKELKGKLQKRKQIKKRTPEFLREEWFRYKRVPKNWRRPDGITSKMRINLKYRPSRVRVGFRGPKEVRGLHSSGFEEVIVYNLKELEAIDPKTQAARIGGSVGTRKRMELEKKAEKLDIRILNL